MSKFINNSNTGISLSDRINILIKNTFELKFLVGFFYFSGWSELVDALKKRDDLTLKILVGLEVDRYLNHTLEIANASDGASNSELADRFFASISKALNTDELDTQKFYEQVEYFLDLLEEDRLHIKKTLHPNHAKLYFFKADENVQGWLPPAETGKFITGSSNLTRAGFHDQHEFNVEIGDYGTQEAEAYFDELWLTAVDITGDDTSKQALICLVREQTQVAPATPFEAYVMVLKTYLELMELKTIHPYVTRLLEEHGYISYQYQMDAVSQALSIIDQYNGVIIADVVGLGKSIIACMIARDLGKRGIVICPPGLIGDNHYQTGWKKYLADFELRKYEWDVFSSGNLEKAAEYLQSDEGQGIEVVIVDEAHRFRNEDTQNYEWLSAICRNRIVILLTATPFNNSPSDIFSMLKLFIVPGKSSLTLDDNLEGRFARYKSEFRKLSYIARYHATGGEKQGRAERYYQELFEQPLPIDLALATGRTHQLAAQIRAVLEPVLIRRNRIDLRKDPEYCKEVTELSDIRDPCELFYELSSEQISFYDQVVNNYFGAEGQFKGAMYQPFRYDKGVDEDGFDLDEQGNRSFQQQRNLYEFMRRLLVKRFESSFGSFACSIDNFIRAHQIVLEFIEVSDGKYILDRKLIEKIYEEDPDVIEEALREFAERLSQEKKVPKHERVYDVDTFAMPDEFIKDMEADLELLKNIRDELQTLDLVGNDSKAERLIREVSEILTSKSEKGEPKRKVIVFSEYVDTVKHIQPWFEEAFPDRVLTVAGTLTKGLSDDILKNFDASVKPRKQRDEFDILITSDKLSEGVNLNRAGAVVNYDIPWNPTRVIQRVGRINRIGKKVFQTLSIYNFFPTEKGADVIKSRQIASQKMFLIHSTLGEDAKIFDIDEQPIPAELYKRVNENPEENEEESLFTNIRREYFAIKEAHPELINKIAKYPARIKTAKANNQDQLTVFRKKGLGLFIQTVPDTYAEKPEVTPVIFEDGLPLIQCDPDAPRLKLSDQFWPAYEAVKTHRESFQKSASQNSLEAKAFNNLNAALSNYSEQFDQAAPFIRTLLKDLRDFHTLPKFTIRRLTSVDLEDATPEKIEAFIDELNTLRRQLGDNYLEIIQERVSRMKTEIIIAVENQKIAE